MFFLLNPSLREYMKVLSLTNARVWMRVRVRGVKVVKMNCKSSYNDLRCRQCGTEALESQEHLEVCTGTSFERRGLDLSTRVGLGQVAFRKRLSVNWTRLRCNQLVRSGDQVFFPLSFFYVLGQRAPS